jgi:hypothetical protein
MRSYGFFAPSCSACRRVPLVSKQQTAYTHDKKVHTTDGIGCVGWPKACLVLCILSRTAKGMWHVAVREYTILPALLSYSPAYVDRTVLGHGRR